MITTLITILICSAIFYGFYALFLEREKTLQFNRLYLLTSLAASFIIPFIKIDVPEKSSLLIIGEIETNNIIPYSTVIEKTSFDLFQILLIVYIFIAFILLIRFSLNLIKILKLKGKRLELNGLKFKITEKPVAPFSFLDTIYLSKKTWNNGDLDHKIVLHETYHLNQHHSWDIIFVEILKIFGWFNPMLYWYKKAIVMNHEYSADSYVLKHQLNIKDYQNSILNEIEKHSNFSLSNSYNFNNTKKRFIMMKLKNTKYSTVKQVLTLPLLGAAAFFFSQKIQAESSLTPTLQNIEASINKPAKMDTIRKPETKSITAKKNSSRNNVQPKNEEKTSSTADTDKITPPEYPGGSIEMRKKISDAFDIDQWDGNGIFKSKVNLVIDKNGNARLVSTEGEDELFNKLSAKASEVLLKTKWQPGTKNGEIVESNISIPFAMHFENQQGTYKPEKKQP